MKYFITFLFLILMALSSSAEVITGGVDITEYQVKNDVFQTPAINPDYKSLSANIIDINNYENRLNLLKGFTELKDRTLAYFSDGSYGIMYNDSPNYVWYYGNSGVLLYFDIKSSLDYPSKTYKYDARGNLLNISSRLSKTESYVYEINGKLIAHWVGENCYDSDGNVIMTRKIVE